MSNWVPLVKCQRQGITEVVKFGAVCWVTGGNAHKKTAESSIKKSNIVHLFGDDILCFGRSLMKPYQMKVFTDELKGVLTPEQKALSLASHNAELKHLSIAQSILEQAKHNQLNTPESMPLMPNKAVNQPSKWNHPCSGKHAGILRGCEIKHWPTTGYQSQNHPYHQAFLDAIKQVLGTDWQPKATAVDGCGLPTFSNTLVEMGELFAALAYNKNQDWIWDSMVNHPDLIGGEGRLDSAILAACNGKVLAKEGADGLLGLAICHDDYPDELGIIIKMAHGWDGTATWFVAHKILTQLGFDIPNATPPEHQSVWIADEVCPIK